MKDSSVAPTGLLNPSRQRRLLAGFSGRFRWWDQQRQQLQKQQQQCREQEAAEFEAERLATTQQCRQKRRAMLQRWDEQEEEVTAKYEISTLHIRQELNRLAAIYRRKEAEEQTTLERKVAARRQAVLRQYENRKNQPGRHERHEHKRIQQAKAAVLSHIEDIRSVTIGRLDELPQVPRAENPCDHVGEAIPHSVDEAIETIHRLASRCEKKPMQMQSGTASKVIDSFYLPAGVAAFMALWALIAFFVASHPPWLAMAAGVPVAGVLGFTIYLVLLWPLKRITRELHPRAERLLHAAEQCASIGRAIATREADEASAELVHRRDVHLKAAHKWREECLTELHDRLAREQDEAKKQLVESLEQTKQAYREGFETMTARMRSQADAVARDITQQLEATKAEQADRQQANEQRRRRELSGLDERLMQGLRRGIDRIAASNDRVEQHFPAWNELLQRGVVDSDGLEFLPVGELWLGDHLRQLVMTEHQPEFPSDSLPESMPVGLHRRLHSGLVIDAPPERLEQAVDLAHQILWRALTAAPPARCMLTLIDSVGRGQHFTRFMALADHDASIVGHRIWTTEQRIESRLSEMAHHIEDVLQSILRDRFQRIEDYNELAGSMAEPYRIVAAVGFPEGLTRDGYKHLQALIESGQRCGLFVVLVQDTSKPWTAEMPLPKTDALLRVSVDQQGAWRLNAAGLSELEFVPAAPPAQAVREELVDRVGRAAVAASRVEIPLEGILRQSDAGEGSTADVISIPVGSQGANRALSLELGVGVRQHVLIAGKTGSGKSTLLHSIITSGATRYRPDELQFYLLDFKKGVEFKPYADRRLPHARVIGIESEREFGRSVLQRLDAELQQRGESFRAAGVHSLSDYRDGSATPLPRIMLIIDEFQELFIRDDRLAGDCAMLLDRLVRQGRSFGMHVVLSSQSLAGAYSLPRATLGQMAVRIAMQCSESDAALILADDNTAARLINRPGEAIYNDAGGLVEGNQPFQVAWLSADRHRALLQSLADRDRAYQEQLPPAVVFEGNRPCRWSPALAQQAMNASGPAASLRGFLGEAVEIGPPVGLALTRNAGRNVLLIAPSEGRASVVASLISGFAKSEPRLELVHLDGNRNENEASIGGWLCDAGIAVRTVRPRDSEAELARLDAILKERLERPEDTDPDDDTAANEQPILLVIDPLERFRDLRQNEAFNFSLDAAATVDGSAALQNILRDGPSQNLLVLLICSSAETLSRWLPRSSHHDLELRILGRINASDSSLLIDTPMASDLSAATMLLYDDADGRITKFRQCDVPEPAAVRDWISGA